MLLSGLLQDKAQGALRAVGECDRKQMHAPGQIAHTKEAALRAVEHPQKLAADAEQTGLGKVSRHRCHINRRVGGHSHSFAGPTPPRFRQRGRS